MALELAAGGERERGPTQKPKAAIFKLNLWSIYATKEGESEEEAKEYANKKRGKAAPGVDIWVN